MTQKSNALNTQLNEFLGTEQRLAEQGLSGSLLGSLLHEVGSAPKQKNKDSSFQH